MAAGEEELEPLVRDRRRPRRPPGSPARRAGASSPRACGRGRLGRTEPEPRGDAGSLVERLVVAMDGLLLVFGEARPVFGRLRRGGVALMDQQDVLHRFLLLGMVDSKTNGGRARGQLDGN